VRGLWPAETVSVAVVAVIVEASTTSFATLRSTHPIVPPSTGRRDDPVVAQHCRRPGSLVEQPAIEGVEGVGVSLARGIEPSAGRIVASTFLL